MGKDAAPRPAEPKSFLIQVTEGGKPQTNVRVPFFMAKWGMKLGQTMGSKKSAETGSALEMLKDIDIDAVVGSLSSGELTLPCLLADIEDGENGRRVKITLE